MPTAKTSCHMREECVQLIFPSGWDCQHLFRKHQHWVSNAKQPSWPEERLPPGLYLQGPQMPDIPLHHLVGSRPETSQPESCRPLRPVLLQEAVSFFVEECTSMVMANMVRKTAVSNVHEKWKSQRRPSVSVYCGHTQILQRWSYSGLSGPW